MQSHWWCWRKKGREGLSSRFGSRSYTICAPTGEHLLSAALFLQGTTSSGVLYTLSLHLCLHSPGSGLLEFPTCSVISEQFLLRVWIIWNSTWWTERKCVSEAKESSRRTAYQHLGKNSCSEYLMKTPCLPSWSLKTTVAPITVPKALKPSALLLEAKPRTSSIVLNSKNMGAHFFLTPAVW